MDHNRYDIKWVGHCNYENSDKIWGWFFYMDPTGTDTRMRRTGTKCYAFWGRTGKTPSFKMHRYSSWEMDKLVQKKKDNRYTEIPVGQLVKMWPSIYDDLDNKFIFHILSSDL